MKVKYRWAYFYPFASYPSLSTFLFFFLFFSLLFSLEADDFSLLDSLASNDFEFSNQMNSKIQKFELKYPIASLFHTKLATFDVCR